MSDSMEQGKQSKGVCTVRLTLVLLLTIPLILSVYQITDEFINDNVVTKMNFKNERILIFPAVTICNLNPVMCSELWQKPHLRKLLKDNRCYSYNSNYSRDREVFNDTDEVIESSVESSFKSIDNLIHKNQSKTTNDRERLLELVSYLLKETPRDRVNMGYLYEDLISYCRFDNKPCSKEDFLHTLDKMFGNCYTFNSVYQRKNHKIIHNPSNMKKSILSGQMFGLDIVFNVNHSQYIPELEPETGIQVLVHDPELLPFDLSSQGKAVSAGMHTSISLRKKNIQKINSYSRKCKSKYEQALLDESPKAFFPKEKYIYGKCLFMEYQKHLRTKYQCQVKNIIGSDDHPHLKDCNEVAGMDDFENDTKSKMKILDTCYEECEKVEFQEVITSTQWPAEFYVEHSKEIYGIESNFSYDEFRRNFGKLSIFYGSLDVMSYSECSRFTVQSMIGSYGGYVGLYVGLSFLSIITFIDSLCRKLKKNPKVDERQTEDRTKIDEKLKSKSSFVPQYIHLYDPHLSTLNPSFSRHHRSNSK